MTILDCSRNLFDFFKTSDIFDLDKDFKKVVLITLDDIVDRAIVRQALKSFEEQGLVVPLVTENQAGNLASHWVLVKPLVEYSQNVELSYPTISAIASTINEICDELNVEKDRVNPLQIVETDLQNLVLLIAKMRQEEKVNE